MSTGPRPNFYEYDVIRALYIIDTKGPIGRHLLKKELGISECSVRTILKRFLKDGLTDSTTSGQVVTDKGREMLYSKHYFDTAKYFDTGKLSLGEYDFIIVAKGVRNDIKNGIAQRDEAIKIGGAGATVLIYLDGKLYMPPGFMDLEESYPEDMYNILGEFDLKEGDVLVIGSGDNKRLAQLAAIAAYESLY